MADIPPLTESALADFSRRNPLLGWGPPVDAAGRVQRLEPRPDPAFRGDAAPCVSAYGDSFTYGSQVADDETYPHDLAARLGCAAANYGAGGYGPDQMLLLWRAQRALDRSPVVIVGHASEDILRSISQLEALLYPGPDVAFSFKPRFELTGDGALAPIGLPVEDGAALRAFARDPNRVLRHDEFARRPRRRFPFAIALARWLLTDFHVRARIARAPRYAAFYRADHPSHALELTTAILATFAREARADGRRAFVLLIPEAADLDAYRADGRWIDQPLADALTSAGVRVIHAGPRLAARPGFDRCALFIGCAGHLTAAGNAAIADIVHDAVAHAVPHGRTTASGFR